MRGPDTWLEWSSTEHVFGRITIASLELAVLAVLLALAVRWVRRPTGRTLAFAWGVVLLKPLATLALGTPIPLLRFGALDATPSATIAEHLATDASREGTPRSGGTLDSAQDTSIAPGALARSGADEALAGAGATAAPKGSSPERVDATAGFERFLLGAWALGIVVLGARWLRTHRRLVRIARASTELPAGVRRTWSGLARECAPSRSIEARVTDELESPALVGLLRPVVLVPRWLIEEGRSDLLGWAMRHELAHARWFDPIAIAVRDLVSVTFFFHPLLPWIRRRHADALESACDWEAVRDPEEAASYATGLAAILATIRARRRHEVPAGALAMVAHGSTTRRVEALLDGRRPSTPTAWSALAWTPVVALVFALGCGTAREPRDLDARADARSGASNADGERAAATLESTGTGRAIRDGLFWLARHQDEDGAWRITSIAKTCAGADANLAAETTFTKNYDTGTTALALLSFLDAGVTAASTQERVDPVTSRPVRFGDTVRKAVERLVADQRPDGASSSLRPFLYNEALVAMALVKAYAASDDPRIAAAAQRAIDFVQDAQRPRPTGDGLWGWRYASRREVESVQRHAPQDERSRRELCESDTSITAWCVESLAAAKAAGLTVRNESLEGALAFTQWVSARDGGVGYIDPRGAGAPVTGVRDHFTYHPASMSALGILTRLATANRRDDPFLALAAKKIVADPPRVSDDGLSVDYYYWHFGMSALTELDGPRAPNRTGELWGAWSTAAVDALLALQDRRDAACTNGAWIVPDRWGYSAGPLYATSLNVLTLVAYVRGTGTVDGPIVR